MGHRLEHHAINVPILFVQADRDKALPPSLSQGMERLCPKMTRESVAASHCELSIRNTSSPFSLDFLGC